ncbi:ArsR family transcriptional regulator [Streptococcus hillyeri]|uniref:ArsR family transcriptional regulator n=1 Tax=Streptococcus hillyeri TaxID=2282420 RepID=A0A3L9DTW2_9STRE|nr:ArsR family transcriptional regulator [Streptococcus hillyeri]
MSFRNPHENYTAINNAFLQDRELEPATIGILAVLLSNKSDWEIYPEEIARRMNISRTTVDRHFKQLEKLGYMKTFKFSRGRGKGFKILRFVSDVRFTDFQLSIIRQRIAENEEFWDIPFDKIANQ